MRLRPDARKLWPPIVAGRVPGPRRGRRRSLAPRAGGEAVADGGKDRSAPHQRRTVVLFPHARDVARERGEELDRRTRFVERRAVTGVGIALTRQSPSEDDVMHVEFDMPIGHGHRIVLFGSRARGDARPDSDYDVAVFLHGMADRFAEMDRLAELGTNICDKTGEFVHAMPYGAATYAERSPLMHEIRKDGLDL
jgi:predicted nucleotidyltransferase